MMTCISLIEAMMRVCRGMEDNKPCYQRRSLKVIGLHYQVCIDNIISFNEKFEFLLLLFVLENVIGLPIDSNWGFLLMCNKIWLYERSFVYLLCYSFVYSL